MDPANESIPQEQAKEPLEIDLIQAESTESSESASESESDSNLNERPVNHQQQLVREVSIFGGGVSIFGGGVVASADNASLSIS